MISQATGFRGKLRLTVVFLSILFASLVVPSVAPAAEPIKFGVSTAISGDAAAYGKPFLDAILMMADIINEEGGLLGRKVEVIYYDDKGVPDHALEISKKLVYEDKVHTLQPGSTSGCIMTGMPAGKEGKVAMWGYGLAKDWLVEGNGMIWRSATPNEVMVAGLMKYAAKDLDIKTIGVIYQDTFYGETAKNLVVDWFTKEGGQISKVVSFTEGDRDFSSQYMTLSRTKPDAIYIAAMGGHAAPAIKQLRQFMDKDIVVLSDNNWGNPNIRAEAGDQATGIYYYMNPAAPINTDPLNQKWIGEIRKRLGEYHEIMSRGVVGMAVMAEAIKRAGSTDAIAIMKEVHKMRDFPTMIGPFTYDPRDAEGLRTGIVLKVEAGADMSKDKLVSQMTIDKAMYDKHPDYKPFFGEGYYSEIMKAHGLN